MEWICRLATAEDDPEIRRLLASSPMPGRIGLTFEREPNYFLGCGTMGRFHQVLVIRHRSSGELAGLACRATRPLFVNGQPEEVGYLGQLRVDPRFQGCWLVTRAFDALRRAHADGRVAGYITTITEENAPARGVLVERPRRTFPTYREVDRLWTLALVLQRRARVCEQRTYELETGSPADLAAIAGFLREHGARKQFFPVYGEADFRDGPTTRGFRSDNFVIARRNGAIAGVLGLWDQSAYKQTVVRSYGGVLRWARPLYNGASRLTGAPCLPRPGEAIRSVYASFVCVAENDPAIFRALVGCAYALAAGRGFSFLLVGLSARDPLLDVAREYRHIAYASRLYTVCWKGAGDFHERIDDRVPYVEIAML
ncbi:MAG: hypothetical protein HY329_19985 [Chloroflexi bacterium]|nr:hypothetical protein [Chloroflexota bacterium]